MKKSLSLILLAPLVLSSCFENTTLKQTSDSSSSSVSSSVNTGIKENLVDSPLDDNYRNFYEIFVSSYADSDGDGMGDLIGVDKKLSYIRDLGFTGIWLMPIFSSSSYHRYNVDDYFAIAEDLGTLDDLKKLVKDAHDLGIKVILDGVFNHSGIYNPWYSSAAISYRKKLSGTSLTDEEENYASLYSFFPDKASADEAVSSHAISAYSRAGANDFYYECNFDATMPELNFDSEFTYTKIQSVIDYYMAPDIGIDGFRLDATSYYSYHNTANNVAILTRINKMVKDNNPKGYLVGECWEGQSTIAEYYKSGADSFFYFPGSVSGGDSYILNSYSEPVFKRNYLSGSKTLIETAGDYIPAPFLSNHDMGRTPPSNDPTSAKFIQGLLAMSTGSSFTYYGDEIGMSSSENSPSNDANYRTHYYWDDSTHSMECNDPKSAYPQVEYYKDSLTQLSDPSSLLNYVRKANLIRNSLPEVSRGQVLDSDDTDILNKSVSGNSLPLLSINKEYKGKKIKIVINFSNTEDGTYDYSSCDYEVKAVLESTPKKVMNADKKVTIPPFSMAVLA